MSHDEQHHGGIGTYVVIFAALLILTALTVTAAFIDFGAFNTVIAMAIAILKAVLVLVFFMHLKGSSSLLKLFVIGAFAWLAILLVFTLNDYSTRHWETKVESNSWITRPAHQYLSPGPAKEESAPSTHH